MILFDCPRCSEPFAVADDRAGLRTTCPKCGRGLTVPGTRRGRWALVLLAVLAAAGLAVLVGLRFGSNPPEDEVEWAVRQRLPAGYDRFRVWAYDRKEGRLKFSVTYREHGEVDGVEYEVTRHRTVTPSGEVWEVSVTGRKARWGEPSEKWLVVDASFDRRGRMTWKRPGVGLPAFEDVAARIARAAHEAF